MTDLLIRGLAPHLLEQLKKSADQHGRSLQKEVMHILEEHVAVNTQKASEIASHWQEKLKGRKSSDSADLLREDRSR